MEQRQSSPTYLRHKRCAEYRGVRHASFAESILVPQRPVQLGILFERPSPSDHLEPLQRSVPNPNSWWRDVGRVRYFGLGEQ